MVRLTADLILRSPQYFNAVKERELDLRGNKVAVIENLGATEDQFDSIDLSDNEIVKLEGFPTLKRLSTLIVNNNRITRINAGLGAALPKLGTLVLTGNRLVNLADLDSLASLEHLWSLSLLDNIVNKKPNYRLYVIHKIPSLRILDFRKVKEKEREAAKKLFGSRDAEVQVKRVSANTFVPGEVEDSTMAETVQAKPSGPTPEQLTAIKAAIAAAQSLEEVTRLEEALKSGKLPTEISQLDKAAEAASKRHKGAAAGDGTSAKEGGDGDHGSDSSAEEPSAVDGNGTTNPAPSAMDEG
eukprot:TRINITY_DN23141_c0_g1_i1.p1 TRINITY_DN23141_c0_g1~~TRINITY_DN23141_c0_g1_i1.p1  ORF type:complete len:299 (+),score=75.73 TRINITY_DN23141_c0_g1_i1:707-1603(+)